MILDDHPGLLEWLAGGERGISSNQVVEYLLGIPALGDWPRDADWNTPQDPSDLARCERLLRSVPTLRAEFRRMANLGPTWAALVDSWDHLVSLLDKEAPGWTRGKEGCAPRCYAAMEAIHERRRATSKEQR